MNKITILGTGNAVVDRCYNTCFVLETSATKLLVDAGGGNGILRRLKEAGISIADIRHLFITHAHIDHILGAVWIVRMVAQCAGYDGVLNVYGNDKVQSVLRTIVDMTLAKKQLAKGAERVAFRELRDGEKFAAGDIAMQCFDIHSAKEKQFGFRAELPTDARHPPLSVVCLGDEPYNQANHAVVERCNWLLCEAFCLYSDREKFKPYEKNHSTALDAGRLASELGAKNLLLYHTEDRTLETRRENYTREAAQNFGGRIVVPDDMEVVEL